MGFGSFIGGILLMLVAIVLVFFGVVVLAGFFDPTFGGYSIPLGIGVIVVGLILFAGGWYSFKSAEPRGTYNVRNVNEPKK